MRGPQGKGNKIRPFGMGGLIGGVVSYFRSIPFAPSSFPGLVLWLDASATTTLFQDAAGTTPATADNDPVGLWLDRSGGVRDVTQGTAGSRPLLKTAVQNGKNIVRFDGTDDLLSRTAIGLGSGNFTIVAANNRGGTNRVWFSEGNTGNNTPLTMVGSSAGGDFIANCRDDAGTELAGFTAIGDDANWHLRAFRRNGTEFRIRVDSSVSDITATLTGQTVDVLTVGAFGRVANASFYAGDLGELVVYNTALADAQLSVLFAYLQAKWGTP